MTLTRRELLAGVVAATAGCFYGQSDDSQALLPTGGGHTDTTMTTLPSGLADQMYLAETKDGLRRAGDVTERPAVGITNAGYYQLEDGDDDWKPFEVDNYWSETDAGEVAPTNDRPVAAPAVSTDEAQINSRGVYVQDNRPINADPGDVWLRPYALPEPSGDPYLWHPLEEGAGTTVNDLRTDEGGTINGPSWVDGSYAGGAALNADGSDEYVETTGWREWGTQMVNSWSVAFTVETTDNNVIMAVNDAPQAFYISLDDVFASAAGEVTAFIRDEDGNVAQLTTDNTYNDGQKHRVVITATGATVADWSIFVDGASVAVSRPADELTSSSSFSSFINPITYFAYNSNGSVERFLDGVLDNVIPYSYDLSSDEIVADYARQLWS